MAAIMRNGLLAGLLAVAAALASCSDDDDYANVWEEYSDWRESNVAWVAEQEALLDENGMPFYQRVTPAWSPGEYVLMHWFNDRSETQDKLVPLLTSTVTTRYRLYSIEDEELDSSVDNDGGVFTTQVGSVISGWQIALLNMHVGDTVQIVVPYQSGYGSASSGAILPYSALRFNIRLADIPNYVTKP